MVTLNEEVTIASPLDAIWPLLRDPAVVAGCIPGAQLSADSEDGIWRGSIRIKFGPTVAQFRGEATLEFDDGAKRVTLDGRGIDGRGASRALANSVMELHARDATTTTMKVEGEFTVTGPLETFVNAGGVHVARALLNDFCTNIAAAMTADAGAQLNAANDTAAVPAIEGSATTNSEAKMQTESLAHAQADTQTNTAANPQANADVHAAAALPEIQTAAAAPAQQGSTELSASALLWRVLLGWLKSMFENKKSH
jgi:carbon monoxide dehydrogenase subunit G